MKDLERIMAALPESIRRKYLAYYRAVLSDRRVKDMIREGRLDVKVLDAVCDELLPDFKRQLYSIVEKGVRTSMSAGANNAYASVFGGYLGKYTAERQKAQERAEKTVKRSAALASEFLSSHKVSRKVWRYGEQTKKDMAVVIDNGITAGKPATEIARKLKSYLNNPNMLFRRVRDKETGELVQSKAARNYHPGQGVYRSSYANAMRVVRTETNSAYHVAEHNFYESEPMVKGYEIRLSNNHTTRLPSGKVVPLYDICDELKGVYPKWFKWESWHPQCYDDQSEVYTAEGWKHFKDVQDDDMILSLNPDIRDLEYVPILLNLRRQYKGQMIHFHNRSYSQLVTPEHEVLYVSSSDRRTFRRITAAKCGKSLPIYRTSEWVGNEIVLVAVGSLNVPFRHFAEFMGYWLSDGSLGHQYEVGIAQKDADRSRIYDCIRNMGQKPRYNGGKIEFNSRDWYEYLSQFGKSYEKYVPSEIKESEAEGIRIFLDAYISCDGHIKPPKSFIGNRGGLCIPTEGERTYCTTSKRMADDIGELILKIGRRPSFRLEKTAGKSHRFRNGVYTINHDIWIISECRSICATQYEKDYVDYDGIVYDLTLAKNNTMYIRRNGKCFWGSNCRCTMIPLTLTSAEFAEYLKAKRAGEGKEYLSRIYIKDVPPNYKAWVAKNQQRIVASAGRDKMPWFLRDNGEVKDGQYEMREV